MDRLREDIERDEGLRLRVYPDTNGHPTVGWGHKVLPEDGLMLGDVIPMERAERFLEHDLAGVVALFARLPKAYRAALNPARRRVVCNMLFNMGLRGVLRFKDMWKAILRGDWESAAKEMIDSLWANQTGDPTDNRLDRAERLAEIMRRGE